MPGRLEGKIALITGAASGIGRATAHAFVREGATVVLADINVAAGAAAAAELGPRASFVELDVTSEDAWRATISGITARFGALHILVNDAGASPHDDIEHLELDLWRKVIALNLESVVLGCKYGVPALAAGGGGSIVNLSSVAGSRGAADYASYGAAKAGVRNLTKSVALYCARQRYNIRCNSIHPGSVDTPILDADKALHGAAAITSRERNIPMHRLGRPEEVANAILFLASDEASYITGTELYVDGGLTAKA